MEIQSFGKWLIVAGILLAFVGLVVMVVGKVPSIGRLPGDILIKRDHFTFYFPLTTCILISLILMLISRFFNHK